MLRLGSITRSGRLHQGISFRGWPLAVVLLCVFISSARSPPIACAVKGDGALLRGAFFNANLNPIYCGIGVDSERMRFSGGSVAPKFRVDLLNATRSATGTMFTPKLQALSGASENRQLLPKSMSAPK
jgi:hypothetical protein